MNITMFSWMEGLQPWTSFYKGKKKVCDSDICFGNLEKQITERKTEIGLGMAYDCWKAVAVLKDGRECAKVMANYLKNSQDPVAGKFGGKRQEGDTQAVIIYCKENDADDSLKGLEESVKNAGIQNYKTFKQRGCECLQEYFGPWENWKRTMKIKYV